jgi:hypothetical protein
MSAYNKLITAPSSVLDRTLVDMSMAESHAPARSWPILYDDDSYDNKHHYDYFDDDDDDKDYDDAMMRMIQLLTLIKLFIHER